MSRIICDLCYQKFGCRKIITHIPSCIIEKNINKSGFLIEFISSSYITRKQYYMYVIFGTTSTFNDIDKLLREWLKCCDHLSIIENDIQPRYLDNRVNYESPISQYRENIKFRYEFDMCSTTIVYFKILKKLNGYDNNNNIDIIYKNKEYNVKCKCNEKAKKVLQQELICDKCLIEFDDDLLDLCLPIVNSPRIGICACGL
jgi:hypothetical protein